MIVIQDSRSVMILGKAGKHQRDAMFSVLYKVCCSFLAFQDLDGPFSGWVIMDPNFEKPVFYMCRFHLSRTALKQSLGFSLL